MLDCPEQSHTSPISTFLISIVLRPLTVSETARDEASGVDISTCQVLSAAATLLAFLRLHETETVIFSPGEALPQMCTRLFCCNTMLSESMAGSFTSARLPTDTNNRRKRINAVVCVFIGISFYQGKKQNLPRPDY